MLETFRPAATIMSRSAGSTRHRRIVVGLGLLAVVLPLALLQCRAWNAVPNADGISYLELAERYASGDASAVANGYWSPLYPALLGASLWIADAVEASPHTTLEPELYVALVVNIVIMGLATTAVARLLAVLDKRTSASISTMQRNVRLIAAGALWMWSSLRLIGVTTITPDLLLATWLLLATAELVEATGEPASVSRGARIGVILGLGYWTKAVFFPVMFVSALAYACLTPGANIRTRLLPLGIAVLLATPLVGVQSTSQGHFTFGDTGRLNYDWYVNDVVRIAPRVETTAETKRVGDEVSRVVQLASSPRAALYAGDLPGSFPFWYDPTRYVERRPLAFSVAAQWRAIRHNARWYRVVAGALTVPCLVVLAVGVVRAPIERRRLLVMLPALSIASLVACGYYCTGG